MNQDFLGDRRKALEDQIFQKIDEQLIAKIRQTRLKEQKKETLAAVSGITSDSVKVSQEEAVLANIAKVFDLDM